MAALNICPVTLRVSMQRLSKLIASVNLFRWIVGQDEDRMDEIEAVIHCESVDVVNSRPSQCATAKRSRSFQERQCDWCKPLLYA